jgi:hypothetical protein
MHDRAFGLLASLVGLAACAGAAGTGGPPRDGSASDSSRQPYTGPLGSCAALPAVGVWQNISPPNATDTNAIIVDPFDPATVWLGANMHGIYKSSDCGASFVHVNTTAALDSGGAISMALDPATPGTAYVTPLFGPNGFWKTTDGGMTWAQLFTDVVTQDVVDMADSVSMDPTNHQHLVVSFHANCTNAYAPTCAAETTDGGQSWRLFRTPPGLFDSAANWEEGAGFWILDATTWLYGGLHLWLSSDSGAHWQNLDPDPAQFYAFAGGEVENHEMVHLNGTYFLTVRQGVVYSRDLQSWTLLPIGSKVSLTVGDGRIYAADQWSVDIKAAPIDDATQMAAWTSVPGPQGFAAQQGCPYLAYDEAHHILYASCFASGAWRLVTQ